MGPVRPPGALYGRQRWDRQASDLGARLQATAALPVDGCYRAAMLGGLPPPVQRYLGAVLRDGQPMVMGVRLQQAGSFNLKAEGAQWVPFTADQQVRVRRPGFVWNARMAMLPGLPVFVVDAYLGGTGTLHASVL